MQNVQQMTHLRYINAAMAATVGKPSFWSRPQIILGVLSVLADMYLLVSVT